MKMKTGPLLVIGVLVLLVGLTVFLTPSPPPASGGHDHEEGKEAEKPKSDDKPEKPKLADIEKALAGTDEHGVTEAFDKLQELVVTARTPQDRQPLMEFVVSLLRDPRDTVRTSAVGLLSGMKDVDYQVLSRLALNDPSPNVKRGAILALANFDAGGPVEKTLRTLSTHPDAGIRAVALVALTQMLSKAGKAGNDMLAMLLGQFDNDSSAQAAMRFHAQGAPALPTLIKTLQTSQSGPTRQAAAMCIGLICAGYNPSIDKFAKQAQVTHRQEYGHRDSNPMGLDPLVRCLQSDPFPAAREVAAQGLGYLGDERAAKPLASALRDTDPLVRRRAAAALITVPARAVVPELSAAATQDQVAEVRRFAVEALGWVGDQSAVPALCQATKDKVAEVRRYAAMQLGKIPDPAGLEALSGLLGATPDADPDVRWAAVVALGKLHDKKAEHVLVQALSDPSPQVSTSAERALQRLGIATREEAGFQG